MRNISEQQLRAAISRADLPLDTFSRIQVELASKSDAAAGFEAAHIAYYLGGLLIIGAMGWFITTAWDSLAGLELTLIGLVYAVAFGAVGFRLFRRAATRVPGGVLVAVAVCMTPMIVYGIERQLGWWPTETPHGYSQFHPYIAASWVLMEAVTVLASFVALRFVRFAFISAPGAYALWYLSMDVTALLFGKHWTFKDEAHISAVFGLVMLLIAYLLDRESDVDLAFWFYLFGLLTFTGGLTFLGEGTELGKAMYCLIHVALIMLSLVLQRRAFLVFGALGVFVYIGGEAEHYFRNSMAFTFALTALGILFIVAGILYKKSEAALIRRFEPLVPNRIRHRHALEVI